MTDLTKTPAVQREDVGLGTPPPEGPVAPLIHHKRCPFCGAFPFRGYLGLVRCSETDCVLFALTMTDEQWQHRTP